MRIDLALVHHSDEQPQPRSVDAAIAVLAERQHGVVARWHLFALGLRRGAIDRRLACGRLHVVHRGVYAVGHRLLSPQGRWMAAVLASGTGAVLSHRSAAALWGIRATSRPRVDVTAPRALHARLGLHPHCAILPPDEITTANRIPTTVPARTLLDLAAVLPRHALERAVNEAEVQRLSSQASLATILDRYPGRRGTTGLRALLLNASRPASTRSELEARFLTFLDHHRLPRPETNSLVEAMEVDAVWREAGLIVELDGFAAHGTRHAFQRDRERDRRLQAAGWRVVRITWRDLHEQPESLAIQLRALLSLQQR